MPEPFLERIRQIVGAEALPDLAQLDRTNDLHVDRAATALLRHFLRTNAVPAFELLVDLTVDRVAELAAGVARDQGLLEPGDELAEAFFAHLFTQVGGEPPEAASFLRLSVDRMAGEAEARARDLALRRASDPEGPVLWENGAPRLEGGEDGLHGRATRICFHRLDLPHRRALRARDVDGWTVDQIAELLEVPAADARELLAEADRRLHDAIERELGGGDR